MNFHFQMVLQVHRFVIWMDASIRFQTPDLDPIFREAEKLGVMSSVGFAPIAARTSKTTFQFLNESPCIFRDTNEKEATFIIIYANDFIMQYFMVPWVSCALTKQCMVPEKLRACDNDGYYFSCHRYDQSILSILLVRLFHRDIQAHTTKHTFYHICKGGYEFWLIPTFINRYLIKHSQMCF